MRKKSMFTRLAAFLMAAMVSITATGCGTKESQDSVTETQASITEALCGTNGF